MNQPQAPSALQRALGLAIQIQPPAVQQQVIAHAQQMAAQGQPQAGEPHQQGQG